MATASYTTSVSKIPGRSSIPEDAASNPHHIVKGKNRVVTGFKNPYPSYKDPDVLKHVIWYVSSLQHPTLLHAMASEKLIQSSPGHDSREI
jgi:hypothetical protein